jgi:hypothetical protein
MASDNGGTQLAERQKTSPGRLLRLALFMAVLACWPVAIYLLGKRLPHTSQGAAIMSWTLVACLAFLIGCAIVLRSWIIAGALIGIFGGLLLTAMDQVPNLMPGTIVGAFIGFLIDVLARGESSAKDESHNRPRTPFAETRPDDSGST